ncbi:MAG: tyrosine-type recombinase/integrase [Polyangia bacterium]|jgi:site-specific recombinase XerC|nr:tyrosine-type recombinase/integrase [Polyangia bacterium]
MSSGREPRPPEDIMSYYMYRIPTPARTLSEAEQARLLQVTGEHRGGFRDHVIFSLALGTGLREHEIAGLNVGDIADEQGRVRHRMSLRVFKRSNYDPEVQQAVLSETLRTKLRHYLGWMERHGQATGPDEPLFVSRRGGRISTRQMRTLFARWQERAGFERRYGFHALRHTACTNHYRLTKDLRLTQRFARHKSAATTERYTHPSIEDLLASVQGLPC